MSEQELAKSLAYRLIITHSVGDLRDEADLLNAQFHALQSVNLAKSIVNEWGETIEEKRNLIELIKNEIPKFHGETE